MTPSKVQGKSDFSSAGRFLSDTELADCAIFSKDKPLTEERKVEHTMASSQLRSEFRAAQECSKSVKSKIADSVEWITLEIWYYAHMSIHIIRDLALRLQIMAFWGRLWQIWRPCSMDVGQVDECSEPDANEGNFGLGYLVFTHVGCFGCDQVLETSKDLSSVMRHKLEWFVRQRRIGHSYFHFSWNEGHTKRQLDINLDLMMEDLVPSTPKQLLALRKFATDVNRYEGREALKVFNDPKALRKKGRRLRRGRLHFSGLTSCRMLTDVCNHCGRLSPCSKSRHVCNHCNCLKECWKLEGEEDFFEYNSSFDCIRACNKCFPYALLYCRYCGHGYPPVIPSDLSLHSDDDTSQYSEERERRVPARKDQEDLFPHDTVNRLSEPQKDSSSGEMTVTDAIVLISESVRDLSVVEAKEPAGHAHDSSLKE